MLRLSRLALPAALLLAAGLAVPAPASAAGTSTTINDPDHDRKVYEGQPRAIANNAEILDFTVTTLPKKKLTKFVVNLQDVDELGDTQSTYVRVGGYFNRNSTFSVGIQRQRTDTLFYEFQVGDDRDITCSGLRGKYSLTPARVVLTVPWACIPRKVLRGVTAEAYAEKFEDHRRWLVTAGFDRAEIVPESTGVVVR